MKIESMPSRAIRLYEVRLIEKKSDNVQNSEGLFYEIPDINSVICFFVQTDSSGHIIGYDKNRKSWIKLGSFDENNQTALGGETDNVVSWISDIYGEDGYGVYGIHESIKS